MEEPIQPTEPIQPEKPLQVTPTPIDDAPANCPECAAPAILNKIFCNKCGYPINGTHQQKSDYEINKYVLQSELAIARSRIKSGTLTLNILGGLVVFFGLLFVLVFSLTNNVTYTGGATPESKNKILIIGGILLTTLAAIYLGLGYWSRKKPFAALLTATIFFVTITLLDYVGGSFNFIGFIIQIIIIVALVKGTLGAYEAEKIMKKLHID